MYVPEFHHHKHHTKYITIHHHHKKPKKHHHHHIHIPKSHPHHYYGYYHTKKGHKTTLKTTTTNVQPSHHHGHHDSSTSYDAPIYGGHYSSASQVAPHIPSAPSIPKYPILPKVHGISHTVKKVKVYDSLPGAIQGTDEDKGYKVIEDDDDDDTFTAVNEVQNKYPSTFNFLNSASASNSHDPFSLSEAPDLNSYNSYPLGKQSFDTANAFAGGAQSYGDAESFIGNQGHEFSSLADHNIGLQEDIPVSFGSENGASFNGGENSFTSSGSGTGGDSYLSANEQFGSDDTPVTFAREAGVRQTINTGSKHTVLY